MVPQHLETIWGHDGGSKEVAKVQCFAHNYNVIDEHSNSHISNIYYHDYHCGLSHVVKGVTFILPTHTIWGKSDYYITTIKCAENSD